MVAHIVFHGRIPIHPILLCVTYQDRQLTRALPVGLGDWVCRGENAKRWLRSARRAHCAAWAAGARGDY